MPGPNSAPGGSRMKSGDRVISGKTHAKPRKPFAQASAPETVTVRDGQNTREVPKPHRLRHASERLHQRQVGFTPASQSDIGQGLMRHKPGSMKVK